jgi:hypothetical protein
VLRLAAYRGLHHDDASATIPDRTKRRLAQPGRLGGHGTWQFLWLCSVSIVSNDDAKLWVVICDAASTGAWFFFLADFARRSGSHAPTVTIAGLVTRAG